MAFLLPCKSVANNRFFIVLVLIYLHEKKNIEYASYFIMISKSIGMRHVPLEDHARHVEVSHVGLCFSRVLTNKAVWPCQAVIGIDLGTTSSSIAIPQPSGPVLLGDEEGKKWLRSTSSSGEASLAIPSLVAFSDGDQFSGSPLVGFDALKFQDLYGHSDDHEIFHSFKRLMGLKMNEVSPATFQCLSYPVVEGDRGEALVYSRVADDLVSPIELSEILVRHLVQVAERAVGETVHGAVVTVPARFSSVQRAATLEAAKNAGLTTVHLLQEPVAAALAYGINGGADGDTVLVFDVGGGTFDVSILQAFEGIMEVLGTSGDPELGGDDIDGALVEWMCNKTDDSKFINRYEALKIARNAKESISFSYESDDASDKKAGKEFYPISEENVNKVVAPFVMRMASVLEDIGNDLFVEWSVNPREAAEISCRLGENNSNKNWRSNSSSEKNTYVANTKNFSGVSLANKATLKQEKWAPPPRRITRVALVGQSTQLPCIRRFVEIVTGVEPCTGVDPAAAVALGAAIQAGTLLGKLSRVELMDGSFVQEQHDRASGFGDWQP